MKVLYVLEKGVTEYTFSSGTYSRNLCVSVKPITIRRGNRQQVPHVNLPPTTSIRRSAVPLRDMGSYWIVFSQSF